MMTATAAWNKSEKLVYSQCWSFTASTGIEFDELLSIAHEKFMKVFNKYGASKEEKDFQRILYRSVQNALRDATHVRKFTELPEGYSPATYDPEKMWYEDLLVDLSPEAAEAVKCILKNNLKTRTECSDMMRNELKYTWPTIWDCMKEIKSVLSNL